MTALRLVARVGVLDAVTWDFGSAKIVGSARSPVRRFTSFIRVLAKHAKGHRPSTNLRLGRENFEGSLLLI